MIETTILRVRSICQNPDAFVVQATLFIDSECVGSVIAWPNPINYLNFEIRNV
jgi:hypothetical protein